jgi:hypothetical protein
VFKKINKGNDQSSEIKSEVRQVLDYREIFRKGKETEKMTISYH